MRQAGRDAENGFGADIGGGLAWSFPTLGLTLDVSGRTLLAHQDSELKDAGFSAGLLLEPCGGPDRGPSFKVRREYGGAAQRGVEALFSRQPVTGLAHGTLDEGRWTMEADWRFPYSAAACSAARS